MALRRPRRPFPALALLALACAHPARAQLDLGSQGIPQDSIDAYMAPFYRLIACGLGADRHLPAPGLSGEGPGGPGPGAQVPRFGWHVGFQGGAVPIPGGSPFNTVDISVLPVFRLEGGLRGSFVGVMARGLAWSDPRLGDLSTFGGAVSLGRSFTRPDRALGGFPVSLEAALVGAWDRLVFASEYTYKYRGSLLSLFDQDIPGDYTLTENLLGYGLLGGARLGCWRLSVEGLVERASGRFRYLYLDPRSGGNSKVASDLGETGFRTAVGLSWRFLRVQAGWRDFPYLSAGIHYGR
jgi:hypothetical protein